MDLTYYKNKKIKTEENFKIVQTEPVIRFLGVGFSFLIFLLSYKINWSFSGILAIFSIVCFLFPSFLVNIKVIFKNFKIKKENRKIKRQANKDGLYFLIGGSLPKEVDLYKFLNERNVK